MATAAFSFTTSAARVENYLMRGTSHDGKRERRYVFAGGVLGAIPGHVGQQFARIRGRHGKRDAKRQGLTGYLSFSQEELDPENPEAGVKALKMGEELLRRAFPAHPGIVVVQRDGKAGLWHAHFLVSTISDREGEYVYRRRPRKGSTKDKLTADRDGLVEVREPRPAGRAISEAMRNAWRFAHIVDSVVGDPEFMASIDLAAYDNKSLMRSRRRATDERVTGAEKAEHAAGIDWRQGLRTAVVSAQGQATSLEDFRDILASQRIELRTRRSRHGTDFGDGIPLNFSYTLHDSDGKVRNARAGGRDGIGDECGAKATLACIESNLDAQRQTHTAPPASAPVASPGWGQGISVDERTRALLAEIQAEVTALTQPRIDAFRRQQEANRAAEAARLARILEPQPPEPTTRPEETTPTPLPPVEVPEKPEATAPAKHYASAPVPTTPRKPPRLSKPFLPAIREDEPQVQDDFDFGE